MDEVLAVGDAAFQQKSMGKMGEVAKAGRTVLFVSHNLGAITQLCGSCLSLEHGRVARIGPAKAVVDSYLASLSAADGASDRDDASRALEGLDDQHLLSGGGTRNHSDLPQIVLCNVCKGRFKATATVRLPRAWKGAFRYGSCFRYSEGSGMGAPGATCPKRYRF